MYRGTKIAATFTAAALVSTMFTTGGAMAAGLSPTAAATQVTSTIQQEVAATEKQYTDAVFTAVDYASIDYEPQQLKDLAVALEDLAKWLYQTGSISDLDLVRGSVGASERLLIKNGEGDGSDAVKASYITASVAVANAKTAWKSIYKQMEAAENASKAESPGIHVAPSHTDADPLPPGSTPTPLPDGSVPLAPTPAVAIPEGLSGPDLFKGPWVTQTAIASIIPSRGDFMLLASVSHTNSMNNFKSVIKYPNFTDVTQGAWYYDSVKQATEYGFVRGGDGNKYNPNGPVTIQEAIMMAARIRCIYEWGSNSVLYPDVTPVGKNAATWATPEINYAIKNGIIQSTDFSDYSKPATRAEMAHIFANVLPESTGRYAGTNVVDTNAIPDVPMSTQYSEDIYKLYKAGILTGTGSDRLFQPNDNIDRASTAAIASRIPLDGGRQQFTLLNPDTVHYAKLADGVTNSPFQMRTVYVGAVSGTTDGQPRKATATTAAPTRIDTRYGFHNYWSTNQAEYDAVISAIQNSYNASIKKGTSALAGSFGMNADSWQVVDDIIAGRPYRTDLWQNYVNSVFPAVAANIKDAKTQAETIRLYAQYRVLYTGTPSASGETGGLTAYDALYLGKSSCNSQTQIQMACADMLGIDCASFVSSDHQSGLLRINGVYFSGETVWAYNSYKEAVAWADFGQMTEWTSATSPLK